MDGDKIHRLGDEAWLIPLPPFHKSSHQGSLSGTFYYLGEITLGS